MTTKGLFVSNVTLISGKDGCCQGDRILKLAGYESVHTASLKSQWGMPKSRVIES